MDYIKIHFAFIQIELENFNEYMNEIEATLKKSRQRLEDRFEEEFRKDPNSEQLEEDFEEDFKFYGHVFPTFAHNSLIVSLFSLFEDNLNRICDLHHMRGLSDVHPKDIQGNGDVEKCKKYLKIITGINLAKISNSWNHLKDVQKIRNAIVHNSSTIESSSSKNGHTWRLIKEDPRFKNNSHGKFYLDDINYCRDLSEHIENFFQSLTESLSKSKVVARNQHMPYDNAIWGGEKSYTVLKQVVHCLDLIEHQPQNESDLEILEKVGGNLENVTLDLTKLYAFFSGEKWFPKHATMVSKQGSKGLQRLKEKYE